MPLIAVYSLAGVVAASLVGAEHDVGSILLAVLGIGSLIFVHESGHFLACKLTGTRVETFSIGFGPRLFGWETPKGGRRRFTVGARQFDPGAHAMDVRIAAIPLGGYVKMAGEIGGDGTATSGAGESGRRAPLPDEFPGKSVSQRIFIASAGVIMNVIAAIVCFSVAFGVGYPDAPPVIGDVVPGGAAWRADLRPGDRLLAYDGAEIRMFSELKGEVVLASRGKEALVEIERDGKPTSVRMTPEFNAASGFQEVGAESVVLLAVRGADGTTVEVGPSDALVVDGRPVVGGRRAYRAIADALEVGRPSVRIERSGAPAVEVSLAGPLGKASTDGPWRIGITPVVPLVVDAVRPGSRAGAGWRVGDEILAADGEPVRRVAELATRASWKVARVRRDGSELDVAVGAESPAAVTAWLADVAFASKPPANDTRVAPSGIELVDGKGPAAAAGLRVGDRILEVDGKPVSSWEEILTAGGKLSGEPVRLKVQSGAEAAREITVKPEHPRDPDAESERFVRRAPKFFVPVSGPLDAVSLGVTRTWSDVRNVFRTIQRFIAGDISFSKNVAGPLSIGEMSSATATLGLPAFLAFLAFISVNLAVLNVLPIPVLDGGTVIFLLAEKLRGRPLADATIAKLQLVGFGLLLVLMFFALKNDVHRIFGV